MKASLCSRLARVLDGTSLEESPTADGNAHEALLQGGALGVLTAVGGFAALGQAGVDLGSHALL